MFVSDGAMATAASGADRATVAVLNGFGRALGDAIIGLQALHVAVRLGAVPLHPVLFRLPGLPPMVEAVHAMADFARIRTLPWEFAAPETSFPAGRFDRIVDLRDFAFDPDFRRSPMIDFFLRRLGVEPRLVPPSSRRNGWLAQHARPEPPPLPGGYVLVCPKASTTLRDMPSIIHERILEWTLPMAPVVTQGCVPDGLGGKVVHAPSCASFAALCGLVRHARWVISTDTAMVHLADAFEVPCLAFFPTHRPEWRVRDYPRCMSVALRTGLPLGAEFARGPGDEALARAAWFPEGRDFTWLDRALAISAAQV
ncbi:MAG TPA: glycosyltransferase family 9 protein [Aliidongia sp.]|nr:glycosyltransferase family 9 protein [Aliidongia sp.]